VENKPRKEARTFNETEAFRELVLVKVVSDSDWSRKGSVLHKHDALSPYGRLSRVPLLSFEVCAEIDLESIVSLPTEEITLWHAHK